MKKYDSWPLGQVPKKWQRPELDLLRESGYTIKDPRDAVKLFENIMAEFVGSKYAVAVSSCTDALFLSLKCLRAQGLVTIPLHTYCSVPMAIIHAGCRVHFEDLKWEGVYQLKPSSVYDGALRFRKGMYIKDTLFCISFQIKKRIPIGKGGMVFTDRESEAKWLRTASFEGRHLNIPYDEDCLEMNGWNMYMSPEDAARGVLLFDQIVGDYEDAGGWENYTDLSKQEIFNG